MGWPTICATSRKWAADRARQKKINTLPLIARVNRPKRRQTPPKMSLYEFIQQGWHVVEEGRDFTPNWHIELICAALEAVSRGEISRLAINIPPGMMKSLIVSVFWPAWEWTFSASKRFVCVTHDEALTKRDAERMRDLIKSPWYQRLWPDVKIRLGSDAKMLFKNNVSGFRYSTTVKTGLTGHRGDRLIIDDAIAAQDVARDVERDFVNNWYRKEVTSRTNDEDSPIVVIGQRLHEEDIFGTLEDLGGFHWIVLPNEFGSEIESKKVDRVMFGKDPRTEKGQLLFPGRLSAAGTSQKTLELGVNDYAAQYNQNPIPEKGYIFEPDWWKFWMRHYGEPTGTYAPERFSILPGHFDQMILSVDATFDNTESADNVALQVWGLLGPDHYLIDQVLRRMSFTETIDAILGLLKGYPMIDGVVVENKANGPAIIDSMNASVPGIVPFNPGRDSKTARAVASTYVIRSGHVYLPNPAVVAFAPALIATLTKFPRVKKDDEVDALTQALLSLRDTARGLLFDVVTY